MKAIELLNIIYNGDAAFSEDLELVERYARLQIEKDRERVKRHLPKEVTDRINKIPIILD